MDEASKLQFPKQLRQMLAFILCYCVPTNSNYLWTKYKDFLIEDFLLANSESMSIYRALKDIEAVIETLGFRLEDFGLPLPKTLNESNSHTNDDSNTVDFSEILNFKQKEVFDVVVEAIFCEYPENNLFFIDGAAGTGKTFVYNAIIQVLNKKEEPFISLASTGIAATLLKNGRTAHSVFKLPLILNETSTCRVKSKSKDAALLKNCKIIIWDEVTMSPNHAINAVNLYLQDLCGSKKLFGGKIILFGGDCKQCLPVIKRGSRTEIIEILLEK